MCTNGPAGEHRGGLLVLEQWVRTLMRFVDQIEQSGVNRWGAKFTGRDTYGDVIADQYGRDAVATEACVGDDANELPEMLTSPSLHGDASAPLAA